MARSSASSPAPPREDPVPVSTADPSEEIDAVLDRAGTDTSLDAIESGGVIDASEGFVPSILPDEGSPFDAGADGDGDGAVDGSDEDEADAPEDADGAVDDDDEEEDDIEELDDEEAPDGFDDDEDEEGMEGGSTDAGGEPGEDVSDAEDDEQGPASPPAATKASGRTSGGSGKTAWDKERTRELFRRYKEDGDMEAREQLVMSHMNLVRFLANKFKNRGEHIEDLMQVGYLGLLKAIDRFDPDRGLEFTTFATPTIMGEIKRYFRDKGWSVRVPRRLQELSAKVNKATDTLTAELQRSPTVEEIAEYLGESVDDVLEAMESSSAYNSVPLEAPVGGDSDDAPTVIDRYANVDDDLAFTDDRIILEDAIEELSPREREVLELRYKEGMTQTQIAEKLGISQVQVSRLLRRTLKKLQDKIDPEGVMSKQ